ncbi:MAG: ChbG/HpnK family deacetylase [Clostridium sp.]|uniref:ChbG/HpnK family deacetylase n=1 Tax=Clostridium sp. TaxID=1506 RepID=UPI003D6D3478
MTNLIFNADDFGYSKGINYGIIEAHKRGVLTSATLMVNMSGTLHAVELMKGLKAMDVGLHLNISLGKPLTSGKTLVDEKGNFMKPDNLPDDYKYDLEELRNEIWTQYNRYIELVGKKPSHIDSHLFSSDKVPQMRKLSVELAIEKEIALRNYDIDLYHHVEFVNYRNYNAKPTLDYVAEYFSDIIKHEYVEIMTHPGFVDIEVYNNSSYNIQRAIELEFLTSIQISELIKKNNINLISYSDVRK